MSQQEQTQDPKSGTQDPESLNSTQQNITQQNIENIKNIIRNNYSNKNLDQIFTLVRQQYPNATYQKIRELYDAYEILVRTSGMLTQPEQHSPASLEIRGDHFNSQGGKRKKKTRKSKKSKKIKKIKKSKKRVHKIRV